MLRCNISTWSWKLLNKTEEKKKKWCKIKAIFYEREYVEPKDFIETLLIKDQGIKGGRPAGVKQDRCDHAVPRRVRAVLKLRRTYYVLEYYTFLKIDSTL